MATLNVNVTIPDASTTTKGIIEIATAEEVAALTDTTRAVTPSSLETGALIDVTPSFITYTGGSVSNSTTTPANIDSSADLNIPGAGLYEFEFVIDHTSAATATGAGFDLGGSTCPQNYLSYTVFGDTGTGDRSVLQWSVYGANAPFVSSRAAAPTALTAIIQGTVNATGAGNIRIRFRSEIAASAITITDVKGYFRKLA
jgi:hypothetical protein